MDPSGHAVIEEARPSPRPKEKRMGATLLSKIDTRGSRNPRPSTRRRRSVGLGIGRRLWFVAGLETQPLRAGCCAIRPKRATSPTRRT